MLIHPWDAAQSEVEWRDWVEKSAKFGVLAVPAESPNQAPVVVPTHFSLRGQEILLHLARPNEALERLENSEQVAFTVFGDYAYIENTWRAKPGTPEENGVPTSYYSAINFVCRPTVIIDEKEIAGILREQMLDFQPQGGYAEIDAQLPPFGSMLSGIRAVRLSILDVKAKFKYDDHKPRELREHVIAQLQDRGTHQDHLAASHQRNRLNAIGEWKPEESK